MSMFTAILVAVMLSKGTSVTVEEQIEGKPEAQVYVTARPNCIVHALWGNPSDPYLTCETPYNGKEK